VTSGVIDLDAGIPGPESGPRSVVLSLLPIMAVVFIGFLVIGLALPVVPLHVHQVLGLGTFVVGLVAGSQFAAALVTRFWSGHLADSRGAKRAVLVGLLMATGAGGLYLLSLRFLASPATSATVLILGRGLLGGAESCIIRGAMTWGLALGGAQNTGRVMAWVGTAMYAAYAVGAPVGMTLYDRDGFTAIAAATALVPLATRLVVCRNGRWRPPRTSGPDSWAWRGSWRCPAWGSPSAASASEAVRRAPAESRGLAMGAYTAFLDIALGVANPALGLVASGAGLGAVFLVSSLVVLSSGSVDLRLMNGDNE